MGCGQSKEAASNVITAPPTKAAPAPAPPVVKQPSTQAQANTTTSARNANDTKVKEAPQASTPNVNVEQHPKQQQQKLQQKPQQDPQHENEKNTAKDSNSDTDDQSVQSFGRAGDDSDDANETLLAAPPSNNSKRNTMMVENSQEGLHMVPMNANHCDTTNNGSSMAHHMNAAHSQRRNSANTGALPSSSSTPALSSQASGGLMHNGISNHNNGTNPKSHVKRLSSVIGLEAMIEERRETGELTTNVVRIEVPFGKPIEAVYSGVHDGKILGSGISGLVRLVNHKATGVKYAVKCLDLGLIDSSEGLHQLREEIFIMCQLDHPNIVRLEEVYESHNEIYLVQQLCVGGELFDRLDEQPDYHYTEQQCARLVKQMLSAVRYIHQKGIIHRDLKLENFLFSTTSAESELKMIDFGLSKHFDHGEVHHEAVGTPYTVAPEVIRGSYGEKCDIWAIGVITYLLLSGDPPFGGCGGPEPLTTVRMNILKGQFHFKPADIWSNVSQPAKDFIISLLIIDPLVRPNAEEAQRANWLVEWANSDKARNGDGQNNLNPNVVKALVGFKEYSDMRKLLCEVLSFTLLPSQIEGLKKEFEKIDTDGRGEITFENLKTVLMKNAGTGSLGSLTEEEVADIFNAMRVRKTDQTIHWHEFIAAGLSQCNVDDRNLKLAFDRLDAHHRGYVTFDDVLDLMGASDGESEASIKAMFQDSLRLVQSKHARITYEDFLLLMKGQTHEDTQKMRAQHGQGPGPVMHSPVISYRRTASNKGLSPPSLSLESLAPSMPVMPSLGPDTMANDTATSDGTGSIMPLMSFMPTIMPSAGAGAAGLVMAASAGHIDMVPPGAGVPSFALPAVKEDPCKEAAAEAGVSPCPSRVVFHKEPPGDSASAAAAAASSGNTLSVPSRDGGAAEFDKQEAPMSFDASDHDATPEKPISDKPAVPVALKIDGVTPIRKSPPIATIKPIVPQRLSRNRSRSYDSSDHGASPSADDGDVPESPGTPTRPARLSMELGHYSPTDSRRGILLPEHMVHQHQQGKNAANSEEHGCNVNDNICSIVKQVVNDVDVITNPTKKTPLVVNRELYRAHRRMRLAVLEASKRFEEQQIMREGLSENRGNDDGNTYKPPPEPKETAVHAAIPAFTPLNMNMTNAMAEEGVAAGLVMRRGTSERQNSTGAERIRELLRLREAERQAQLAAATKKSGRSAGGRRSRRNKTVSDMSVLMAGMPSTPETTTTTDVSNGNGNSDAMTPNGGHRVIPSLSQSTSSDLAENGSLSYATSDGVHMSGMSYSNSNMMANSLSWTGPPPDMSAFRLDNASQEDEEGESASSATTMKPFSPREDYPAFARASQSQPVVTIDENYSLTSSLRNTEAE